MPRILEFDEDARRSLERGGLPSRVSDCLVALALYTSEC